MYETCTGSKISFFQFFPRTSGQEALYSKKELKKIEFIEPVQVSCTLTLRRIEIIEPVQVSCISPLRNLNTSKYLLTRSPRKKLKKMKLLSLCRFRALWHSKELKLLSLCRFRVFPCKMPFGILKYTSAACTIRNFDVKVLQIHGTLLPTPRCGSYILFISCTLDFILMPQYKLAVFITYYFTNITIIFIFYRVSFAILINYILLILVYQSH